MRIGIMQPYFLPYMGYWQLIRACDLFILNDDVQTIRHGWISRNRILKPGGGWQYVTVPLARHASTEIIGNLRIHDETPWRQRLLRQMGHYRRLAPFHAEAMDLLEGALALTCDGSMARLNHGIITKFCRVLGITTPVVMQSDLGLDYSAIRRTEDWSLQVTLQMGGSGYINPVSGGHLYDADRFARHGIDLGLLTAALHPYRQAGRAFEPGLSVIDALMFLGVDGAARLLDGYGIVWADGRGGGLASAQACVTAPGPSTPS